MAVTSTGMTSSTTAIDTFFVGREYPIEYSPAFYKRLNQEFDNTAKDVDIDLSTG